MQCRGIIRVVVHVLEGNRAKPYIGEVVTRVDVTYRASRESAAFFCAEDACPVC